MRWTKGKRLRNNRGREQGGGGETKGETYLTSKEEWDKEKKERLR